jgi:hypothetical protein
MGAMGDMGCRCGMAVAALLAAAALGAGCAGRRPPPAVPGPGVPARSSATSPESAARQPDRGAEPVAAAEAAGSPPAAPAAGGSAQRPRLRDLCREEGGGGALQETRRRLEETFCGATLWFDGLLGGDPSVKNAREVSGRVELSTLYTQAEGIDPKGRLRLRYDLPTLERRVNLFLGRDDQNDFVEDRREGAAIRSSVFGLDTEDKWLAGLGYSPPGRWASKLDFRVGGQLKTAPTVFAQTRYRRNYFLGERSVWRLRETVFWENRQGYGSTTDVAFDRVLHPDLVFRWDSIGTFSEGTDGLAWRSASLLYHNLGDSRAVAGEVFARGATDAPVPVREYGVRGIYREPVGKPYLFGELIVGYTWPRKELEDRRNGSAMLGVGAELLFGRKPY